MEEFQSKYTYVTDNKQAPRVNPKPPISYFAQNNLNNLQLLTHHRFPIKPYNTPLLDFETSHPIFIPPTSSSIRIIQHLFLSPLFITLPLIHCWQIQSHQEIPPFFFPCPFSIQIWRYIETDHNSPYAPIICDSSKTQHATSLLLTLYHVFLSIFPLRLKTSTLIRTQIFIWLLMQK